MRVARSRERHGGKEKQARESSVFVAWRREDITRVAIERAGGGDESSSSEPTTTRGATTGGWAARRCQRRGRGQARRRARVRDPWCERSTRSLSVPGLDAPRARVTVTMGAVVHRAALGGEAPTPEGAGYLREGDRTVVVARDLVSALLAPADSYRSRVVVPYLSVELVSPGAADARRERRDRARRRDELRARPERAPSVAREARRRVERARRAARRVVRERRGRRGARRRSGRARHDDAEPIRRGRPRCFASAERALGTWTTWSSCATRRLASRRARRRGFAGLSVTSDALIDTHLFAAHDDEMAEVRLESLASPASKGVALRRRAQGRRVARARAGRARSRGQGGDRRDLAGLGDREGRRGRRRRRATRRSKRGRARRCTAPTGWSRWWRSAPPTRTATRSRDARSTARGWP